MPKTNKLIIAAAGAGKTTHLINEALRHDKEILITTYTEANENEIKKKFIEINGSIPKNVTIQTWFSMLLQHGVKPYQDYLTDKKINGMLLVNEQSGLKFRGKFPVYYKEEEVDKHYFSKEYKIYSDKLSKFVFKCNEKSDGAVFDRLSRVYDYIFIDEVQDLAGYDLELIKLLFLTNSNIVLVGDPRQTTYNTHWEKKNKQYQDGKIKEFIQNECKKIVVEIDETSLNCSYRNNELICQFSSKLFPDYPVPRSNQNDDVEHKGIYFIKESDVDIYLAQYQSLQLIWNRMTKVNVSYPVMNFGESKGLGFNRVLVYPTQKILDFILKDKNLDGSTRAKFYVAITRARHSVGIIYNFKDSDNIENIEKWVC
ncbi:UvrD-helicase domain-containing protein [Sulfuricurvum sp.]|uniref:UvrD-helicase domain-containing protein n=1 Tax=Sulfuricurvum sp. TaxID=2025608 RepID=UPI0026093DA3|nr:UvrD-helicase domain-containing protein [Sulfuricurvum sp.]MDD4950585.1 UvrD-helicase domain-containing protein [Sulfuricurvum sp.]